MLPKAGQDNGIEARKGRRKGERNMEPVAATVMGIWRRWQRTWRPKRRAAIAMGICRRRKDKWRNKEWRKRKRYVEYAGQGLERSWSIRA